MQVVMLHNVTYAGVYNDKLKIGVPNNLPILVALKACFQN
ncbi:Hypothetical protein ADU72_1058 [Pediococcus damnosus]|uniref:Uncharacterized protein n=1 Tax=Pediococcus damnosus TaxID=51663 RepID=A0AAC9B2L3_9LACO|nr:Hypothetical protein ADU70_1637 [Pediococcus damnosus]AMV64739.1 Hypothetical protein ADU71_0831 [Pediococcus damnosus]AMV66993.1 Hypothetical protein ADU72_1058 [Pediococcus damnosus]AMV69406.1 Hypothetical protein ADU73_1002 [Pediococcus damnosus]